MPLPHLTPQVEQRVVEEAGMDRAAWEKLLEDAVGHVDLAVQFGRGTSWIHSVLLDVASQQGRGSVARQRRFR